MNYNKILIEIHHGLGDVVQMIPLILNLRKNFPNAKISVIVSSKIHSEILESTKIVDEYYFLNIREMNIFDLISFIVKIRKEKYDIGFLSHISNRKLGAILLLLLGCKIRVGEHSYKDKFIIKNNVKVDIDENIHKIDRNLNLLRRLNLKIYDSTPFMEIEDKYKIYAKEVLKKLKKDHKTIVICVGTNAFYKKTKFSRISYDVKKWNLDKYISLISKISNKYNIILLGGKKEELEIKEYFDFITKNKSVINLINKTSILESASIINECDLVFGADTGMMHIADALGKKTLTIFGPTNPELVGPYSKNSNNVSLNIKCQYCYGTNRLYECKKRLCIDNIEVDYVYEKIENIFKSEKE